MCGDGVVDDGEACDDGDDDPEDGCDGACARTGAVQWQRALDDLPGARAVAVDAAGRIVLVGGDQVLALDPGGATLWQRTIAGVEDGLSEVVVDGQAIYVASALGVVLRLDSSGEELWRDGEVDPEGGRGIAGIAVAGPTFYALFNEGDQTSSAAIRLHTHDAATGTLLTALGSTAEVMAIGEDLAVSGGRVLAVGVGSTDPEPPLEVRAMVAVFDLAGTPLSFDLGNTIGSQWHAVAATGDGGFLLAGADPGPGATIRRLDADLKTVWTRDEDDLLATWAGAVAAGPGDVVATAGHGTLTNRAVFVHRFTGAGEPVWSSTFEEPQPIVSDTPEALAFGPDFVVALGATADQAWLRRFALE